MYDQTGITTDEQLFHDFADIPIDTIDGESELIATITQTTFPFGTEQDTIYITEGDNGFKQFNVNAITEGKRIQGKILFGQTDETYADGYRIIIRDEQGAVVSDELVNGTDYITPKLEEGFNGTISALFPTDDA